MTLYGWPSGREKPALSSIEFRYLVMPFLRHIPLRAISPSGTITLGFSFCISDISRKRLSAPVRVKPVFSVHIEEVFVEVGCTNKTDSVDKLKPAVPRHCPSNVPAVPEKGFRVLKSSAHGVSPIRSIRLDGLIWDMPSPDVVLLSSSGRLRKLIRTSYRSYPTQLPILFEECISLHTYFNITASKWAKG